MASSSSPNSSDARQRKLKRRHSGAKRQTGAKPRAKRRKPNPEDDYSVEEGACPHLQELVEHKEIESILSLIHYKEKLRTQRARKLNGSQSDDPPLGTFRCLLCADPEQPQIGHIEWDISTNRRHACIRCINVGCLTQGHAFEHVQSTIEQNDPHLLTWDLEHDAVYCWACGDYVYHDAVDQLVQRGLWHDPSRKCVPCPEVTTNGVVKSASDNSHKVDRNSFLIPDAHGKLGLRGMFNLGNTCFMSSVLQSLAHNPILRKWFLADNHKPESCANEGVCIACDMDRLFTTTYNGKTTPHDPVDFLHSFWKISERLAGYAQQDAHEFLTALLNHLQTAISGKKPQGWQTGIINRIFGGVVLSEVKCRECGHVSSKPDPSLDFSLDLKAHQDDACSPRSPMPQEHSLQRCFQTFTRPQRVEGYRCSECQKAMCTKQLTIERLPLVLTIHLKRFKQRYRQRQGLESIKIHEDVQFPVNELDMTPFVTPSRSTETKDDSPGATPEKLTYQLYALIEHTGSIESGHYIAYVLKEGHWYKCDDQMITSASVESIKSAQTYMLFYVAKSLDQSRLTNFSNGKLARSKAPR